MEDKTMYELSDDEMEHISGGVAVGDVVRASTGDIVYCSNCGRLLKNYEATITGIRGVLDGKTLYWVTRHCCGWKSSMIETEIL